MQGGGVTSVGWNISRNAHSVRMQNSLDRLCRVYQDAG